MGCLQSRRSKAVAPIHGHSADSSTVQVRPQQPKPLCAAGCGKPTFNGKAGEYCSKNCRSGGSAASAAICATPGCGKPSWNGKPGAFCTKFCKASGAGAICLTPGCGKPTWNGQPNEFCSRVCRTSQPAAPAMPIDGSGPLALVGGPEPCANPFCTQQAWNGQPGEYCSRQCRDSANPGGGVPAALPPGAGICATPGCGKPSWNGMPGEFCSKACKGAGGGFSRGSSCSLLQPGTHKYDSIRKQYEDKWDRGRCTPAPIKAIYEVSPKSALFDAFNHGCSSIGNVKCFGHGTNPGNVQRRFHGTRIKCNPGDPWVACSDPKCSACRIVEDGFDLSKLGSWSGNKGHYGGGLYYTSMSSTAKGYGLDTARGFAFDKGNWMDPAAGNAILIVNIACGRVENVKSTCSHALDLSQFDSRKVDKPSGADELIVFKSEQTLVRAIIVF